MGCGSSSSSAPSDVPITLVESSCLESKPPDLSMQEDTSDVPNIPMESSCLESKPPDLSLPEDTATAVVLSSQPLNSNLEEGLFEAISQKNVTMVTKYIAAGVDVNAADKARRWSTFLHLAVSGLAAQCLKTVSSTIILLLLDAGADPTILDEDRRTAQQAFQLVQMPPLALLAHLSPDKEKYYGDTVGLTFANDKGTPSVIAALRQGWFATWDLEPTNLGSQLPSATLVASPTPVYTECAVTQGYAPPHDEKWSLPWTASAFHIVAALEATAAQNRLAAATSSSNNAAMIYAMDGPLRPFGRRCIGHTDLVTCLAFSPNGKTLASASADATVRLWDATTGSAGLVFSAHTAKVCSIAFSPAGDTLASASDDDTLRLWETSTGQSLHCVGFEKASLVIFSPDGRLLTGATQDGHIRLWQTTTDNECPASTGVGYTLSNHSSLEQVDQALPLRRVIGLCFSPDGGTLVSVSDDGMLHVWDLATRSCVSTSRQGMLERVVFSPDGRILAGVSSHRLRIDFKKQLSGQRHKEQRVCLLTGSILQRSAILGALQLAEDTAKVKNAPDGMCLAIQNDNFKALIKLMEFRPDLTQVPGKDGLPPLHLAAKLGRSRMLDTMLDLKEVDMNCVAPGLGDTPLHSAVAAGQEITVKVLIAAGADFNVPRQPDGRTALHLAVGVEHVAIVALLASCVGINVSAADAAGDTPLHVAVQQGFEMLTQLLLEAGAETDTFNNAKESALLVAARSGNCHIVKQLIDAEADANVCGSSGLTPLQAACAGAAYDLLMIKLLLEADANPDALPLAGEERLLLKAVRLGDVELLKLLLDNGADPDITNADLGQNPPLVTAAHLGSAAMVRLLLEKGAHMDVVDIKTKASPLLLVVQQRNGVLVDLLLAAGAASGGGGTLSLAQALSTSPDYDIASALVRAGVELDSVNEHGYTLLHSAALDVDAQAVRLLLEGGADATIKNKKGMLARKMTDDPAILDLFTELAGNVERQPLAGAAARPERSKPAQRVAKAKTERINLLVQETARKAREASAEIEDTKAWPVFISFRVKEAGLQAKALKKVLEDVHGVAAFCSEADIHPGTDWVTSIFKAMDSAKVVVVLASETYGSRGSDIFATYEELTFALKERKPIYVVKMAERVQMSGVQALLNNLQGWAWPAGEGEGTPLVVPPRVLQDLLNILEMPSGSGQVQVT